MRHECNCPHCDRHGDFETEEDYESSMDKVLDSIGDAQLKAMWALRLSVSGNDRRTVNKAIKERIAYLYDRA